MGTSGAIEVDRVVVAVAAVAIVLLAAQVRVLVATALGDDTARRAGRVWSLAGRLDRTGTLLWPALLALAAGVAIGWHAPGPVRSRSLPRSRRVLLALSGPASAALVAAVALAVRGTGTSDDPAVAVAATAVAVTGFWLLPAPPLPGGALVGEALRGAAAARWQALARRSVTPYGMVAGVVLVLPGVADGLVAAVTRGP